MINKILNHVLPLTYHCIALKNFNNDNSGEFGAKTKWHQNSPELLLLKFLPLTYHHSHFLTATLDFTSFFTIAFLRAALFFTAWLFWIRLSLLLGCITITRTGANTTKYNHQRDNLLMGHVQTVHGKYR